MDNGAIRSIAVVDYGIGNLRSVSQVVAHVVAGSAFTVRVTGDPDVMRAA